jgi:osmotically-inducible protein OsmY
VYSTAPSNIDATAAPAGANSQDWALAEQIRGLLTSDRKLGDAPMAAVVHNGVVTLRGGVRNDRQRQELRDEIGRLPGVQRVDDQMEFRNPIGLGPGEAKSY